MVLAAYSVVPDRISRLDVGGFANTTASIAFADMSAVTIDTGQESAQGLPNTIDVESTPANSSTTINAGTGMDEIELAHVAKNLNVIAGRVTVNGNASTNLTIDDSTNAAIQTSYDFTNQELFAEQSRSWRLRSDRFHGRSDQLHQPREEPHAAVSSFFSQVNRLNVESTNGAAAVSLNTGNSTSVVAVGDAGNRLDAIGKLSVSGGPFTSLDLDDEANRTPFLTSYLLKGNTVKRTSVSVLDTIATITFSGIHSLELDAGGPASEIDVEGTSVPTTVKAVAGTFLISVSADARNLDSITGALTINGAGTAPLVIDDQNDPNAFREMNQYDLTSTNLTRTGFNGVMGLLTASITYSGVGSLELDPGAVFADNEVHIESTTTSDHGEHGRPHDV